MPNGVTTDRVIGCGAWIKLRSSDTEPRAGHETLVNGLAQFDGGVGEGRAHVLQCGEADVQIFQGVVKAQESGAAVVWLLVLNQMDVAIDQARARGSAEVDDTSALGIWILSAGPTSAIRSPLTTITVRQIRAGLRIEQASSANRHALRGGACMSIRAALKEALRAGCPGLAGPTERW